MRGLAGRGEEAVVPDVGTDIDEGSIGFESLLDVARLVGFPDRKEGDVHLHKVRHTAREHGTEVGLCIDDDWTTKECAEFEADQAGTENGDQQQASDDFLRP